MRVLQQTAKAYDAIFYKKNNDLDTLYYPPETRWVDLTEPTPVKEWVQVDTDEFDNPVYGWVNTGSYHPNYAGEALIGYNVDGTISSTLISEGDEYVEPVSMSVWRLQPEAIIDEDGYSAAEGGGGSGCVRIAEVDSGLMWSNDPSRGVASLDDCDHSPAYDLAVAYGLNLAKLGYDAASTSLLDPWGNRYLWGASTAFSPFTYNATEAQDLVRDPHYWSFYSTGPDGVDDTSDDILPAADRIPGYWLTEEIANPIP